MFENLQVETAERRAAPRVVDVDPQVVAVIDQAWDKQKDDKRDIGHIVSLANATEVDAFHKQARAACVNHDPELKYRRLSRVGADKSDKKAYFSLKLLSEYKAAKEAEPAKETPAKDAPAKETPAAPAEASTPAKTPPARPAHRTTK